MVRIWSNYNEPAQKSEVLCIKRVFDREEMKEDPFAAEVDVSPSLPLPSSPSSSFSTPSSPSVSDQATLERKKKITPSIPPLSILENFYNNVLYPNHLSPTTSREFSPEIALQEKEMYSKARALMTKLDKLFLLFVIAFVLVHYLKQPS